MSMMSGTLVPRSMKDLQGGGVFGDVTMKKKKDQAHTVSITRKPIKIDGEYVRMSPVELYHRPLCIAIPNGPPDPGRYILV